MENSIDSILSSVMENEDLMSKIRDTVKSKNGDTASSLEDVISLIAPALNSDKNDDASNANTNTEQAKSEKADEADIANSKENELNSFLSSFSHTISKNTGLLIALKPYLSKERCQMIDSVVKVSRLAEAIKLL